MTYREFPAVRNTISAEERTRLHQAGHDTDTVMKGLSGPFEYWEGDHTALVHVLWHARHRGFTLDQPMEIANLIRGSRYAAARAANSEPAETAGPGHPLGQTLSFEAQDKLRRNDLDSDTVMFGYEGPFSPHDGDQTSLIRVLSDIRDLGLNLVDDVARVASIILRSRYSAADAHFRRTS